MKMQNKIYRQGDVLIERIAKPEGEFQPAEGKIVLAHGEVTGHHHAIERFEGITIAGSMTIGLGQSMILSIPAPVEVTHQEHAPIQLPKGTYRVTRQREYSPAASRNVAD